MPQFGRTKRQSTYNDKQLEYVFIDDFTPGIYDDYWSNGGKGRFPEGAAQVTNTYGCIGAPNGGLIPAPKKIYTISETLFDVPTGAVSYLPNDQNCHIVNTHVVSPVTGIGNGDSGAHYPPQFPDDVWMMYQWWGTAVAGGTYGTTVKSRMYKVWQVPDSLSVGFYDVGLVPKTGNIAFTDAAKALRNPLLYGNSGYATGRSKVSAPTQPGYVVTTMISGSLILGLVGYAATFPNNATPTTDSTQGYPTSSGNIIIAHQNRFISFGSSLSNNDSGYGTAASIYPASELYSYTDANNYSVSTSYTSNSIFYTEAPFGIGSVVSMNSNELFIIKNSGGGLTVSGDVSTPTVRRLPGIESTGWNTRNEGDILHGGSYAYGSDSGFWEWSGGNKSSSISEGKLSNQFWVMAQMQNHYTKGSSSFVYPFLFTPNNYCYDTRTKGWWRYSNPSIPYAWCKTNAQGNLITSPAYYNNIQNEVIAYWDLSIGQPYYTWQSHPLPITQTRLMECQELTVLAQPYSTSVGGTITITIEGVSGTGGIATQTEIFSFSPGSKPGAITRPTYMQGYDMTVRIQSQSSDKTSPAPRLYHIGLGFAENQPARN